TGTLYLLDSTYSIRIFASMEANAYDERVLSINKDPSRMPPLLAFIDNNAAQYRDIGLQGSDTVLCFVTCESGKTNGRALVFARLEQIATRSQGEDAEKKRQEEMGDVQEWFEEE
ncbi:MAG: hypothetical protein IJ679_09390, partial [Lachnospiraceae bacterium]|nr:hypothetical protein [Lachnospiraceae bacterium]